MDEVEVAVTPDELAAEVLRSRLSSEGIPARVVHRSQVGLPGSWSPAGLGFGIGSFSVRVPRAHAVRARAVTRAGDGRSARTSPASLPIRPIATILLIGFLLSSAAGLVQLLPELTR